jgi:23S rRNA pseudouridine1911/1915/1917 synthase
VVADTVYGRRRPSLPIERHFLHASRLVIRLPGQTEPRTFEAPLPQELVGILERLEAEK